MNEGNRANYPFKTGEGSDSGGLFNWKFGGAHATPSANACIGVAMDEGVIVRKFMDANVHITPSALDMSKKRADGELMVEQYNALELKDISVDYMKKSGGRSTSSKRM